MSAAVSMHTDPGSGHPPSSQNRQGGASGPWHWPSHRRDCSGGQQRVHSAQCYIGRCVCLLTNWCWGLQHLHQVFQKALIAGAVHVTVVGLTQGNTSLYALLCCEQASICISLKHAVFPKLGDTCRSPAPSGHTTAAIVYRPKFHPPLPSLCC